MNLSASFVPPRQYGSLFLGIHFMAVTMIKTINITPKVIQKSVLRILQEQKIMGAAASLSVGNETVNNVNNSTVNKQNFSVDNCAKIINSLKQEATLIAGASNKFKAGFNNVNKNKMVISGITVSGEGSSFDVSQSASSNKELDVKMIANCIARLSCSTNATDTTMFQMITDESSKQKAASFVTSTAGMETETTSGGLFTASLAVGVGNSAVTNVNNSIVNCFESAVSNYMSSAINRSNTAASVSTANNIVEMAENDENVNEMIVSNATVTEGGSLKAPQDAMTNSKTTVKQMSTLDTKIESNIVAVTSTTALASTSIRADQEAKVEIVAETTMSNKTAVSSAATTLVLVAALAIGGVIVLKLGNKSIDTAGKKIEDGAINKDNIVQLTDTAVKAAII